MATGSANGQAASFSIDERTQECLRLIKNGNNLVDIFILMGRKGAGKSSIMEDITGTSGHSKDADENDIATEKIQIQKVDISDQCFMMDTPGFDQDEMLNTFYMITRAIQEIQEYTRSWVLVYVTKIVDFRIEMIDKKLFELVMYFSGESFSPNVIFVTTHWNWRCEKEKQSMNRSLDKRKDLWGSLLTNGARMYHHGRTDGDSAETESSLCWYRARETIAQRARSMISGHYENLEPRTPLFVRELRDGVATFLTTAGSFLDPPPETRYSAQIEYESFLQVFGVTENKGVSILPQTPDKTYNDNAQEEQSATPPPQPQVDAPGSRPAWLECLDTIRSGGWVQITNDGPPVDINGGKLTFNGIALTKAAWQALTSARGTPARGASNQLDPSIVNYLNARGMPSDIESRRKLAVNMGLDPSTISKASGNTKLLNLLRSSSRK